MLKQKYLIRNSEGLHARPAANFTQIALKFKSNVIIRKAGKEYKAKSLISVLSMGALKGDEIEIEVVGIDEGESMLALIEALNKA